MLHGLLLASRRPTAVEKDTLEISVVALLFYQVAVSYLVGFACYGS